MLALNGAGDGTHREEIHLSYNLKLKASSPQDAHKSVPVQYYIIVVVSIGQNLTI